MQVTINNGFKPVNITLTCETQRELDVLCAFFRHQSLTAWLDKEIPRLREFYEDLFRAGADEKGSTALFKQLDEHYEKMIKND